MAIAAAFTTCIPVASSSVRLRAVAKKQVVNSWSGGRRALVVGSTSGLFVGAAVAAAAVAVVAGARAMATENGHEAVLATRRGMQLFEKVQIPNQAQLPPREQCN